AFAHDWSSVVCSSDLTTRDYPVAALRHDRFVHARLGTDWLESAGIEGTPPLPDSRWLALAAALLVERRSRPHGWLAHWSPSGPRSGERRGGESSTGWR